MKTEEFYILINEQFEYCLKVLDKKSEEYAAYDDRLHNFKSASIVLHMSPKRALTGMMSKHFVSIYDMCASGKDYPEEMWLEKITDTINYLLLLKAIVAEETMIHDMQLSLLEKED